MNLKHSIFLLMSFRRNVELTEETIGGLKFKHKEKAGNAEMNFLRKFFCRPLFKRFRCYDEGNS